MQIINALLSSFALVDTEPPVITLDLALQQAWSNCDPLTTCYVGVGCEVHGGAGSNLEYAGSRGRTNALNVRKAVENNETIDWAHDTSGIANPNTGYCKEYQNSNADPAKERQHQYYRKCVAKAEVYNCTLPSAQAWDHHDGNLTAAVKTFATLI